MEGVDLCFPQLLNTSCRTPKPLANALYIYIILSFIAILTVVLNLLVIISISHFRQLHTPTNYILLSLAVTDFLVGLLVMPFEMLLLNSCWMFGDILCVAYYFLPVAMVASSVGHMILISVDRYVAICDPLHYSTNITKKSISIYICLCWVFGASHSLIILYDSLIHPGRYNSCNGKCNVSFNAIVDLLLSFIIPIAVITLLYTRVFVVVVSQARVMRSQNVSVRISFTVKKSEIKAARTLGITIAVFFLCYSPYYMLFLTGYEIIIGAPLEAFVIFLLYFNSCLNPVLYVCVYRWFRKSVRTIVTLQILKTDSCKAKIL